MKNRNSKRRRTRIGVTSIIIIIANRRKEEETQIKAVHSQMKMMKLGLIEFQMMMKTAMIHLQRKVVHTLMMRKRSAPLIAMVWSFMILQMLLIRVVIQICNTPQA